MGEVRQGYPLTHLDSRGCASGSRMAERYFPGAHSDVGGGNSEGNIISRWSLTWMAEEANRAGVPMTPLDPSEGSPDGFGTMPSDQILVEGAIHNPLVYSPYTAPFRALGYWLGLGEGSRREVSPGGCSAIP